MNRALDTEIRSSSMDFSDEHFLREQLHLPRIRNERASTKPNEKLTTVQTSQELPRIGAGRNGNYFEEGVRQAGDVRETRSTRDDKPDENG